MIRASAVVGRAKVFGKDKLGQEKAMKPHSLGGARSLPERRQLNVTARTCGCCLQIAALLPQHAAKWLGLGRGFEHTIRRGFETSRARPGNERGMATLSHVCATWITRNRPHGPLFHHEASVTRDSHSMTYIIACSLLLGEVVLSGPIDWVELVSNNGSLQWQQFQITLANRWD